MLVDHLFYSHIERVVLAGDGNVEGAGMKALLAATFVQRLAAALAEVVAESGFGRVVIEIERGRVARLRIERSEKVEGMVLALSEAEGQPDRGAGAEHPAAADEAGGPAGARVEPAARAGERSANPARKSSPRPGGQVER